MRSAFITFVQAATKSLYELLLRVRAGIDLREARSCECEPKMRSTLVPVHLTAFVLRSRPSYTPSEAATACQYVLMSSRSPRRLGKDAVLGAAGVCAEDAQAAKKYRHLRPEDEASRAMIGSRVSDW